MLSKRRLNTVLRQLAQANATAHKLRAVIAEHSIEVYGVDPGEVDNDAFIDLVDGGCGQANGMTADEFDKSMRNCLGTDHLMED